jgi:cyclophilin family peptidyl-prolyl cis-trans isomerase/HEAT repeat protein
VIAWWLGAVAIGGDASTLQILAELEWSRSEPLPILVQIAGADEDTRAVGARALGRLRNPAALDPLTGLVDDRALEVRVAAAVALGATPGATDLVRERLAALIPPRGPGPRAAAADGEMVALLDALGRQGTTRDLGPALEALREPWPVGAAAARALGRMGVRRVPALDEAVGPLVSRLGASDPRIVADAAWALSRIGLEAATEAEVGAAWLRIESGAFPETRAWLLKAAWPVLSDAQRKELFVDAATDASRLVRVALFAALRPGDVPAPVLASFLADPDSWARSAVIDALGRLDEDDARDALTRHAAETDDLHEVASAIAARGTPMPDLAADRSRPAAVRAAAVSTLDDPAALVTYALEDDVAMVRTAAAGALLDRPADPKIAARLLSASDVAVREAGAEMQEHAPPVEGSFEPLPSLEDVSRIRAATVTTSEGTFRIALDPSSAPLAVANFAALAEKGFYDNLVWHRVVPGFVAQTGCPRGDGWGGPGYAIPDEVSSLPFDEGAVGMARAAPDTGGSQWFVTTSDQPHLVGEYTRFGQVVEGMYVVRRLAVGSQLLGIEIERIGEEPAR